MKLKKNPEKVTEDCFSEEFPYSDKENSDSESDTDSLSKTVFSVKPLFKRFKRFEKSLKRPIFESELV
jgi:hypothetical protein